ncbi:MAG: class I SAM-dependent methyltransferase [Pseudohongiella sp.]|nr:class I SAM-dependent methyltransferase [Pseudohongiella sp.]
MSAPMLFREGNRLCLGLQDQADAGILTVDFFDSALQHRIARPLSSESLVKAMGSRPKATSSHPLTQGLPCQDASAHLIDATAGLGQDAFILACAGWYVTMVEQSPLVHALLEDGLKRGLEAALEQGNDVMLTNLSRMYLMPASDSQQILQDIPQAAVIYLDPMFPEREKSARVKKNRYLLQQLHGEEAQGENLLKLALGLARKVVVKRPLHAHPLNQIKPSGAISGKTARFDIYAGAGVGGAVTQANA